jgi:hypothetical protein
VGRYLLEGLTWLLGSGEAVRVTGKSGISQDALGNVFVAAVGFVHNPLALVVHDLLLINVFQGGGFSVAGVQGLCIDLDVLEYPPPPW